MMDRGYALTSLEWRNMLQNGCLLYGKQAIICLHLRQLEFFGFCDLVFSQLSCNCNCGLQFSVITTMEGLDNYPYNLPKNQSSMDIGMWPGIEFPDIYMYLISMGIGNQWEGNVEISTVISQTQRFDLIDA